MGSGFGRKEWNGFRDGGTTKEIYITQPGKLIVQNDNLVFVAAENGQKSHIPVKSVDSIICTGYISISNGAIRLLSKEGIILVFGSERLDISVFYPANRPAMGKIHIKQAKMFLTKRIEFARSFLEYGMSRQILLYSRLEIDEEHIESLLFRLKSADTVERLMAIEGEFYKHFYRSLDDKLPPDIRLGVRAYRPPINKGNALVSYVNSLLYMFLLPLIESVGLDSSISFLHEPRHGIISLSLDIAEMYRPFVIPRTLFLAVNKYKIHPMKEFVRIGPGWYLFDSGRKKVTKAFSEIVNMKVWVNSEKRRFRSLVLRNLYILRESIEKGQLPQYLHFRV